MLVQPRYDTDDSPTPKSNLGTFEKQRLLSLDVFRGLIMGALAFNGLGLARTAHRFLETQPESVFWKTIAYQFEHVEWTGWAFWDFIQPAFMFMVGVALAYSYAKREENGMGAPDLWVHAGIRSVSLALFGVFLISNWTDTTNWSLVNVLTQIGLGYPILYLFARQRTITRLIGAVGLLLTTYLIYALYPTSGLSLETGAPDVGVSGSWARAHLTGIDPHWHKNANAGHAFDLWLLNLFPRAEAFTYNGGGYQTLNFLPSAATMLFGLICGETLRARIKGSGRARWLAGGALSAIALGVILDVTGVCPIIKRLWTPSWALFSSGVCVLILLALYWILDVRKIRFWAFPFKVVGMNSIAIYTMGQLLNPWSARTLQTHFGGDLFQLFGTSWAPTVEATLVGLFYWTLLLWLYTKKVFIRF